MMENTECGWCLMESCPGVRWSVRCMTMAHAAKCSREWTEWIGARYDELSLESAPAKRPYYGIIMRDLV